MKHVVVRRGNPDCCTLAYFLSSMVVLLAGGTIVLGLVGGCEREEPASTVSDLPQDKQAAPGNLQHATLEEYLKSKGWLSEPGDAAETYAQMFMFYETNKTMGKAVPCDEQVLALLRKGAQMSECTAEHIDFLYRYFESRQPPPKFRKDLQDNLHQRIESGEPFDFETVEALAAFGCQLIDRDHLSDFWKKIATLEGISCAGIAVEELRGQYSQEGKEQLVQAMDAYYAALRDVLEEAKKMRDLG